MVSTPKPGSTRGLVLFGKLCTALAVITWAAGLLLVIGLISVVAGLPSMLITLNVLGGGPIAAALSGFVNQALAWVGFLGVGSAGLVGLLFFACSRLIRQVIGLQLRVERLETRVDGRED